MSHTEDGFRLPKVFKTFLEMEGLHLSLSIAKLSIAEDMQAVSESANALSHVPLVIQIILGT